MSWQTILAIGSGGFIGAILRAYFNGLISHRLPHDLPFGTLGVNLIGSFIMGLLVNQRQSLFLRLFMGLLF